MKIEIPIKPLSLNKAHHGKHIKTAEFLQYEKDVCRLLPIAQGRPVTDELFIKYVFYIKNYWKSDTGNLEKLITDLLVKRGYIRDDRFVKGLLLFKEKVKDIKDEKILIDIVLYDDRYKII